MSPTSSTIAQAGNKIALNFIDLPREVRDQVYFNILCDFQYPDGYSGLSNFDLEDYPMPYAFPASVDTAILKVSRQVRAEALEIMLNKNHFIRIIARSVCMQDFTDRLPIRIIFSTFTTVHPGRPKIREKSLVEDFEHAAMSYYITDKDTIGGRESNEDYNSDLLIPGSDLPLLVESIGSKTAPSKYHHQLVFHDPRSKFRDPAYHNTRLHQTLLQPFMSHFHEFPHFTIEGAIDPELAASVTSMITTQRVIDLPAFLLELADLKDAGDQKARQHLFASAAISYRRALAKVYALRASRRHLFNSQDDFGKTLGELYMLIHCAHEEAKLLSNQDELLVELDRYHNRAPSAGYEGATGLMREADSLYRLMKKIIDESGWEPTDMQIFKVQHSTALAALRAGYRYSARDWLSFACPRPRDDTVFSMDLGEKVIEPRSFWLPDHDWDRDPDRKRRKSV